MVKATELQDFDIPEMDPIIRDTEFFERDLYTYVNYEQIAEEAHKRNACMKESKEFYGERLLANLERNFKGKSKEEIRLQLLDFFE